MHIIIAPATHAAAIFLSFFIDLGVRGYRSFPDIHKTIESGVAYLLAVIVSVELPPDTETKNRYYDK